MDVASDFYDSLEEIELFEEVSFAPPKHIFLLFSVVVILCSLALWYALRPSTVAFAQGTSSEDSAPVSTEFVVRPDTGVHINPIIGVKEPIQASGVGSPGALSTVFTAEVRHWEPQILRWAKQFGVDANIIATIMQIESCGNPVAISHAGARGLFQVMPFHFQPGEDMFDPDTNAIRGLSFFNEQLRYTGGDVNISFAGYNGGYAASGGAYATWPSETQRYFYWAKGIYADASADVRESETLREWLSAGGHSLCVIAANELGIIP
jgi:soluble lytic murein transglycosylase-like protein